MTEFLGAEVAMIYLAGQVMTNFTAEMGPTIYGPGPARTNSMVDLATTSPMGTSWA